MAALLAAAVFAFAAALFAAAVFLATAVLAAAALAVRFNEDFGATNEPERAVFADVFFAAVFAVAALLTFALGAAEAARLVARADALFAERAVRARCVFDAEDFEDLEAVLPRAAPGAWAF